MSMFVFGRGAKGFTLTEIMVVTAIITLIIGIALPNLTRMKANAAQSAAIKALRTLNTAFEEFWQDQSPHRYPRNLAELDSIPAIQGSPEYVDSRITDDNRYQGYYFSVVTPDNYTYSIQATPINPAVSGQEIFAVTTSGTISNNILTCPSGNTENGFQELGGRIGGIRLPAGHPRTPADVPPG